MQYKDFSVVIITKHAIDRLEERGKEVGIEMPSDLESFFKKLLVNAYRVRKPKDLFIHHSIRYMSSYYFRSKMVDDWYFPCVKNGNRLFIVTLLRFDDKSLPRIISKNGKKGARRKRKNIYYAFPRFNKLILRNDSNLESSSN